MTSTSGPAADSRSSVHCDEYDPRPAREQEKTGEVLTFQRPDPRAWLQKIAFVVNRIFNLAMGSRGLGRVTPVIPPEEIRKLRAIPAGAGNVMVGPHPSTHDPFLMYNLYGVARRIPAGFLMASETFYQQGPLRRQLLRRLGAIPVARGRRNPEAIDYMTDRLAEGKWCGIFPEGEMYYSREVMPMEYGALRIAVEAALKVRARAERGGPWNNPMTPILVTPFAHVYFFTNREKTISRLRSALEELEARSEVFGRPRSGDVMVRLRSAADRLLEHKAEQYAVPRQAWDDGDRFARAKKLQTYVLQELEKRYRGGVQSGYERRRALKVRMRIFEILRTQTLDEERVRSLELDIQKTRDIVMTVPFNRDYLNKHSDLEMWTEYLRRFRNTLRMPEPNLGPQRAVFEIMPSLDAHGLAECFLALDGPEARMEFLFDETEELRATIQQGVERICRRHSSPDPSPRAPLD